MKSLRIFIIFFLIFGLMGIQAQSTRQLNRMEIYPSNVTMEASDVVVFTCLVFSHNGTAHTPQSVNWQANYGTIDYSGRYTAPSSGGTYSITASYGGLRASAQVTIKSFTPTPNPTISRVTINPNRVSLRIGQTYSFQATAYDYYNNPVSFYPMWSVTGGGSIDSSTGSFYATNYGTYMVTAKDQTSNIGGNATVIIGGGQEPPSTIRIEVFPPKAVVKCYETCQFTGTAYDQYGRPVNISPLWTATGGTITQNGYYTASGYAGYYQIWLKDTSSGAQATVQVQITSGGHPGPGPNPGYGKITIISKDIGGGNVFKPRAKVTVQVQGQNVQSIKLYSISPDNDVVDELKAYSCVSGGTINFDCKYDRFTTRWLEFRLYNTMNQVIARERLQTD